MNPLPPKVETIMLEHFHDKNFLSSEEKTQFIILCENKIENSLRDLIKSIKKRMVLLIGDDSELLQNLGEYCYLNAGETPFYNYSLGCKSEDELQKLFATADGFYTNKNIRKYGDLINRLEENCSVFLMGLDCKDSLFLQRLTGIILEIKKDWSFSSSRRGLLLISTLTPVINIPPFFKNLFEVINLTSTNTDTGAAAKKPQTTPPKQRRVDKLFYTFDSKDRIKLSSNRKCVPITLTEQETRLFKCLCKDRNTPDEIIGEIWNVYAQKDFRTKRKNVKELRGRLNKRCSEIGVETAISELIDGYYSLTVEAVER